MTSKREDREALIEAFKSKASEWDSYDFDPDWDYSTEAAILADIALAVFEQAHTPTDTDDFPHGHPAIDHELLPPDPTDDEREVLAELIDPDTSRAGWNANAPDVRDQINGLHIKRGVYRVVDRILAAGFRRPVQREPSRPLTPCGNIVCTGCRECGCPALGIESQGEPTDDERIVRSSIHGDVDAIRALDRLLRRPVQGESNAPMSLADDPMRAPFLKARKPQGEPTDVQNTVTIPEHLSKRDELGPAIRKVLVDNARAENEKRRGEDARRLRTAVTEQGGDDRG